MGYELRDMRDAHAAAVAAADVVVEIARSAVATAGHFTCAFSGGRTPTAMFAELDRRDVAWERTTIFQVDERVVARDDSRRNVSTLRRGLVRSAPDIEEMPVDEANLEEAAAHYGERLPAHFDLVHLGLGPDGHTASLVPGDPVLEVEDRLVGVTASYQDARRMTLTYPALARARLILWLVTGADKREALSQLLAGDVDIPAGRVRADASLIVADRSALA